ncbi:hypothetical protein [Staphylococcus sp. IVB6227]|uniref:hypothetical protein n=1 Tax=Staphylococcus sp. IVB6227 TaxID=2989768 RepID=UPI0021D09CE6|nr:hypothetical protein [Staphylococcus sp. IVB6227]UXR79026.1 hypothetical protein MUA92_03815 [Staphylococcus sp. IVB6227]
MQRITLAKEELELLNSVQKAHLNQLNCLIGNVLNEVISRSKTLKEAKEKLKELRVHSGMSRDKIPLIAIYKEAEEILEKKIDATPIQEWHRGEL